MVQVLLAASRSEGVEMRASALELGGLLTGTIVVEQVFGLPGLGATILGAISARDYPVVQGVTILAVVVYITVNWLADILQLLVDPRLRTAA